MRIEQLTWKESAGWDGDGALRGRADLVLYFGANELLRQRRAWQGLAQRFPDAMTVTLIGESLH